MHLAPLVRDLAVILGVAGVVTLIFQRIRQPVVLGYLIAGFLIGPFVTDLPNIRTWAELGVIFLMFSLGLDFSFRKLAKVGISSSATAALEVSGMLLTGFALGSALGWRTWDSVFLGAMLAISSTTIIIKSLDELKLRTRRFAEMIFGLLIVEDLLAILILVALTMMAGKGNFSGLALLGASARLVLVVGSWFLVGYFVVPRFVRYVGRTGNNEMLTILSLGFCISLSVLAAQVGYSSALGAFIMGSILAESTESHRIEDLIAPLRDVFSAIFFVSVGMLIDPSALARHWGTILLITAVYLVAKVLLVTLGALITGQTLRTAIQVAFGVAQIGEFSFLIATLGLSLRVTSEFLFPIAVAVSLITTFFTPFLIRYSHKTAVMLEGRLSARVRDVLNRYAAWSQERRADAAKRSHFYRLVFKWFLNGILVSVVFVIAAEVLVPLLSGTYALSRKERPWLYLGGWSLAIFASGPFLWAMLTSFSEFRLSGSGEETEAAPSRTDETAPRGGTVFAMRLLTGIWIGALSLEFFVPKIALFLTGLFALVLFLVFFKRLEASYRWFERRFLSTFEPAIKTGKPRDVLRHLAPWDAHLVRIKVHPNAEIAGKPLSQSGLRENYGLSVVAIQRGLRSIVAPKPEELLFPKDELLVLGTDEQIESVRYAIEKPPGLESRYSVLAGYELKQVRVGEGSPLCDSTIRRTGIGERFGAMVVGLERGDRRMINPDGGLQLQEGDVLWIVGETAQLGALVAELSGSDA